MTDQTKPKNNHQTQTGLMLTLLCVFVGVFFAFRSLNYAFYWFSGLAFGYVLQKSRFCFTAGFRDTHLLGSTLVARAVLVALGITTVGFSLIKYAHVLLSQPLPGMDYVQAIGLYTVLGGVLFGVGMVIAGGCASGVLMRIGDGFTIQMVVLIFFVLGSLLGARDLPWWKARFSLVTDGVFLPDVMGWPLAVAAQLILIVGLYFWAKRWEAQKMED